MAKVAEQALNVLAGEELLTLARRFAICRP